MVGDVFGLMVVLLVDVAVEHGHVSGLSSALLLVIFSTRLLTNLPVQTPRPPDLFLIGE